MSTGGLMCNGAVEPFNRALPLPCNIDAPHIYISPSIQEICMHQGVVLYYIIKIMHLTFFEGKNVRMMIMITIIGRQQNADYIQ